MVVFRLSGRARSTGIPFEVDYTHFITLRDGKVLHIKLYTSRTRALAALGELPAPGH